MELCVIENKYPAINARDVSKSYKLFSNRKQRILDALGVRISVPTYVALRNFNLKIATGERVGVVGRNGAGKSTLLKMIGGFISPTSGSLDIAGSVQVLMHVGLGFHPDFTGRENIRASILYNGLPPGARSQAEKEIIEFVELDMFLDQPLRTYSLGMRSRLQFACATAMMPEILVIDEVLAVGDTYFLARCRRRMQQLTANGCTLLLASHSVQQINDFCERAIWIDQGTLRMDGSAASVTAAYQDFMLALDSGQS